MQTRQQNGQVPNSLVNAALQRMRGTFSAAVTCRKGVHEQTAHMLVQCANRRVDAYKLPAAFSSKL